MKRKGQKGIDLRVNKGYLSTRKEREQTGCGKSHSEEIREENRGIYRGKQRDGLEKPSLTVTQSITG